MRLDKKLMTAVATIAAVFSLGSTNAIADGHGKVEPIKMRWASDHSGPPHPAAIAETVSYTHLTLPTRSYV